MEILLTIFDSVSSTLLYIESHSLEWSSNFAQPHAANTACDNTQLLLIQALTSWELEFPELVFLSSPFKAAKNTRVPVLIIS